MIELERHITRLLLSNDCVIIPNFGGFVAHYVDAVYDADDSLFYPPLRTIGFNQQLKINDSMLVQSYVEAYDMSYPEALTRIEEDVDTLKTSIECNGSYELHDLGTLRLGSESQYDFEPCEAGILTPSLYGLSTFEFNRIKTPSTVSIPSAAIDSTDDDERERGIYISYSALRYAAAACILVALLLLFPSTIGNDSAYQLLKSKIDTSVIYNIVPKDVKMSSDKLLTTKQESKNKEQRNAIAKTEKTATAVDTVESKPQTYYTIVLASMVSKKNANAFVARLQKSGYEDVAILPMGRYAKVVYKQFSTQREAQSVLNKINDNAELADAWVTKIEPKP